MVTEQKAAQVNHVVNAAHYTHQEMSSIGKKCHKCGLKTFSVVVVGPKQEPGRWQW